MTDQPRSEPRRSPIERFFGGNPVSVIIKLAFVSLLVGIVMAMFGVDAREVVEGAISLVRDALRDGFGVFNDLGFYIATGAALVVPIWLVMRLLKSR